MLTPQGTCRWPPQCELIVPAKTIPISAAVPACRRHEQLRVTLTRLQACDPPPAEILVHLDGNDAALRALVVGEFPQVRLLHSATLVGPGGARNRLMHEARCNWVAHFDDDSFPENDDYFAVAAGLITAHPEVAVWAATITSHESGKEQGSLWQLAVYPGCGHLMRKAWFSRTQGYQCLPIAYNMEEVDVSLQLHALGALCIQSADLRVWHDHPCPRLEAPEVETAMLVNTVFFALLRFPVLMWPHVVVSFLRRWRRIKDSGRAGRILLDAVIRMPVALSLVPTRRRPVSVQELLSWLWLRRNPVRLTALPTSEVEGR